MFPPSYMGASVCYDPITRIIDVSYFTLEGGEEVMIHSDSLLRQSESDFQEFICMLQEQDFEVRWEALEEHQ